MLCLRILQSALVYVNTLMLQDVLGESEWADLLTPADRRGLTPHFWSHVRPYGEVNLDMDSRLNLAAATVPGPRFPLDDQPTPSRDREKAEPSPMQAKRRQGRSKACCLCRAAGTVSSNGVRGTDGCAEASCAISEVHPMLLRARVGRLRGGGEWVCPEAGRSRSWWSRSC